MMWKIRGAIADGLRRAADAICEDTTYRCFPARFRFETGVGMVIVPTDGVSDSYDYLGAPLYLREDEYNLAHGEPRA